MTPFPLLATMACVLLATMSPSLSVAALPVQLNPAPTYNPTGTTTTSAPATRTAITTTTTTTTNTTPSSPASTTAWPADAASCQKLGWPVVNGVCGATKIGNTPLGTRVSHDQAMDTCGALGLRLCTVQEIKTTMPLPKNRAPNHFRTLFWASTACPSSDLPNQFEARSMVAGIGGWPACFTTPRATASVMCCADDDTQSA
ncbi:hypothetical protein PTSG_07568 [Salpingoeca rosetta]|uniref:Uncharacterized protein n=1 Tax=Salpingoeca rosetta (strain ATCC 50818 / BSB-021) TaxID=946362 RepID=F2UH50_SALR5|nr:uncharacterized protein PTSG_07568 [Salpingoeca rosetta]EGD76449.1 hypothetical protein PTSG_07568 [Salpingoeca rosetta]|eukprot:XP_004991364.1 hypothetical protein PTSG_07568 [Salpingoeca rosetta]